MQPVGLMFKQESENPFSGRITGELSIVHVCLGCGKVSRNRIAGDDNTTSILSLLSFVSPIPLAAKQLTQSGIQLLTEEDEPSVLAALFGNIRIGG